MDEPVEAIMAHGGRSAVDLQYQVRWLGFADPAWERDGAWELWRAYHEEHGLWAGLTSGILFQYRVSPRLLVSGFFAQLFACLLVLDLSFDWAAPPFLFGFGSFLSCFCRYPDYM